MCGRLGNETSLAPSICKLLLANYLNNFSFISFFTRKSCTKDFNLGETGV